MAAVAGRPLRYSMHGSAARSAAHEQPSDSFKRDLRRPRAAPGGQEGAIAFPSARCTRSNFPGRPRPALALARGDHCGPLRALWRGTYPVPRVRNRRFLRGACSTLVEE